MEWATLVAAYQNPIVVGTVTVLIVFLLAIRNKIVEFIIDKVWKKLKLIFKSSYFLNRKQIVKDQQIHDLLVELRVITNSDRTAVYRFHNGIYFSQRVSGWRVSCTSESVTTGINSEVSNFQNIISSCIINMISCLWDFEVLQSGIEKISPANCNCSNKIKCLSPNGVYLIDVNAMSEGYSKSFLLKQGIKYFIFSPLLDNDNRLGFVGISYCGNIQKEDIMSYAELVCQYAYKISYLG